MHERVKNTNSLRENTETENFTTDIENMSNKPYLSNAKKYPLLKNDFKPSPAYKFPLKFLHQFKRQFKVNYFESYQ